MMKDTFYFQHDYNARNDPKIIKLMRVHGLAGVGAYWCIVEQLYQNGGKLPLEECESIAFALHTDTQSIESIITDFDLFHNDGMIFWSDSINKRIIRRQEIAESRKRAAETRWKNANAIAMQMQSNCKTHAIPGISDNGISEEKSGENGVDLIEKDANAVQKHPKSMQMQCNEIDLNNKDINNIYSCKQESETGVSPKVDFDRIINLYHSICKSYPRILKLSDNRKRKVEIRFVDEMKCDFALLESVFRKMEESKFLRGDNPRGWKATFDWLFTNDKNWLKVAEGNYDNRSERGAKRVSTPNANEEWQ